MTELTFRAAVLRSPEEALRVETVTLDGTPTRGEVLVKLKASGVCHSDYHGRIGEWTMPTPMVLGHEGAGIVEAVGEGVTSVKVGDHVVLCWTPSCGKCQYCVAGRPVLCDRFNETGAQHRSPDGTTRLRTAQGEDVSSFVALGTFGEYAMVPEAAAIAVRRDIPFAEAALIGCAVTTGIGAAVNTAGVRAGSSVLVIGCGGVGLNIIQGAALAGARTVIAADLSDAKLETARALGATHLINSGSTDLLEAVRGLTDGRGAEFAFEAIGLAKTIELAYQATSRGGTTTIAGQVPEGVMISIDPFEMSDQEKVLRGSNYGSSRPAIDFPRIADLHMEGRVQLSPLVTRRIRLEDDRRRVRRDVPRYRNPGSRRVRLTLFAAPTS